MKHILSLSLGSSKNNADLKTTISGRDFRITHLGADFDTELFESLLKTYEGKCDAIAVSYLPAPVRLRGMEIRHSMLDKIESGMGETPMHMGHQLRSILMNWTVQKAMSDRRIHFEHTNLLFMTGLSMLELAGLLAPTAQSVKFLDPWAHLRIPKALNSLEALERYARFAAPVLKSASIKPPESKSFRWKKIDDWLNKAVSNADFVVSPGVYVENFDLERFRGKTLILDSLRPAFADRIRTAAVENVYYPQASLDGIPQSYSFAVLEAILGILRDQDTPLTQEDILDALSMEQLTAELMVLNKEVTEPQRKYAFIIHPLSRRDFFRHPLMKPLNSMPESVHRKIEAGIARFPGVEYGRVSGTKSESTGARADGIVYTLFATPREMLEARPEDIYRKLIACAEDAQKKGCKIIGLGAFTKIVGDAGVTVAARSPIPVTTGNSLSAAATLWAARDACLKMGFLKAPDVRGDLISGTVMIIGATGSIGKACTKVLAGYFQNIIVAATNGPRLMQLQKELKEMAPDCQVRITSQPDRYTMQSDLIVVSTSALDGGVFSLANVKPGCVICDVSRPLTFTAEEAMTRPDVLIIESGEIELPGDVKISCDIGLNNSVVYACLAETALLALEGRYESFTLSRNINYKKVSEIYRLAKKHGARLAEIHSPTGLITDEEIDFCREHAFKALKQRSSHGG